MPEVSRFFGIIIRMFVEAGGQHHMPHFHAYYQDHVGIYDIGKIERLAGFSSEAPGTPCSGLGRASSGRVIVELADVATGPAAH
jgi:Domain of unknown function (DUF4160)